MEFCRCAPLFNHKLFFHGHYGGFLAGSRTLFLFIGGAAAQEWFGGIGGLTFPYITQCALLTRA